jgi:hypothetical protein
VESGYDEHGEEKRSQNNKFLGGFWRAEMQLPLREGATQVLDGGLASLPHINQRLAKTMKTLSAEGVFSAPRRMVIASVSERERTSIRVFYSNF